MNYEVVLGLYSSVCTLHNASTCDYTILITCPLLSYSPPSPLETCLFFPTLQPQPLPLPHLEECLLLARKVLCDVLLPAVVHLLLHHITVVEEVEQAQKKTCTQHTSATKHDCVIDTHSNYMNPYSISFLADSWISCTQACTHMYTQDYAN